MEITAIKFMKPKVRKVMKIKHNTASTNRYFCFLWRWVLSVKFYQIFEKKFATRKTVETFLFYWKTLFFWEFNFFERPICSEKKLAKSTCVNHQFWNPTDIVMVYM